MSTDKIVHTSFAILPFKVKSTGGFEKIVSNVNKAFKDINPNIDGIVDTTRYHGYIKNYLSKGDERDAAFLRYYHITQNFFEARIGSRETSSESPFAYHPQRQVLKVVDKNSTFEWKVEFLRSSYVVLNEFCGIGYFVMGFDFEHKDVQSFIQFRECEFFRFIHSYQRNTYKYFLHVHPERHIDNKTIEKITIYDILKFLFSDFIDSLYFIGQDTQQNEANNDLIKVWPVLLHLIKAFDFPQTTSSKEDPHRFMYDLLRIRRIQIDHHLGFFNSQKPEMINGTLVGALNEGGVVMDFLEAEASNRLLINKYLPAFLLALNQRQAMVYVNERISTIKEKDISNIEKIVIEKFKVLKKEIDILHLKQVFFTISYNDEISDFYQKVQQAFQINLHLEDNKSSVKELYTFLEESRLDEESREQSKRDFWMNMILAFIGCLGVFGFLKDLFPFWEDSSSNTFLHTWSHLYKWAATLMPFVLTIYLYYTIRKSIK